MQAFPFLALKALEFRSYVTPGFEMDQQKYGKYNS